MSNQLLPCPFCGGLPELRDQVGRFSVLKIVVCGECLTQSYPSYESGDTIAAWNRRAKPAIPMPEDELAALIERNEHRKRAEAAWRKMYPNAYPGSNSIAADDIDQLLALVADLQAALLETGKTL